MIKEIIMPTNNSSTCIQAIGGLFSNQTDIATGNAICELNRAINSSDCAKTLASKTSSDLTSSVTHITTTVPEINKTQIILIKENQKTLMPECIMESDKKGMHYTTVKWNDGTYTTVKVSQDDSCAPSTYMAFCAALAKKMYGTNAKVHRIVDRHILKYINDQKAKIENEKKMKQQEEEHRIHHRKVLAAAKRMRIKEEAKKYMKTHEFECCCEND